MNSTVSTSSLHFFQLPFLFSFSFYMFLALSGYNLLDGVSRLTLKYKTQTELEAREDQDGFLSGSWGRTPTDSRRGTPCRGMGTRYSGRDMYFCLLILSSSLI
ncbi:hypothetical protein NC651_021472 [Populus alba x Populus x berolinensis]|nr:hypothetical protein NC651_021472 [Populus alba x Populus x berolinensis]